jgi:hypothetical protein
LPGVRSAIPDDIQTNGGVDIRGEIPERPIAGMRDVLAGRLVCGLSRNVHLG